MLFEIGRQVIYQQGCFSRIKIWYDGWIPNIHGVFTRGWQNEKQTVVSKDAITPIFTFEVTKCNSQPEAVTTAMEKPHTEQYKVMAA
jgi:hypothetical protein